jgi:hypothetical protein
MDPSARVCPFCGEPPGSGVFCESCGRNLAAVDQLPTRAEWEARQWADAPAPARAGRPADGRPLAERCAEASAAFLEAMHAAGDPGTEETTIAPVVLRRRKLRGWVVRQADVDVESTPRRNEPGLVLAVDGQWFRLDTEVRGWGQRDFPRYEHSVGRDPIEMPVEEALIGELDAVLRDNDVAAGRPFARD